MSLITITIKCGVWYKIRLLHKLKNIKQKYESYKSSTKLGSALVHGIYKYEPIKADYSVSKKSFILFDKNHI